VAILAEKCVSGTWLLWFLVLFVRSVALLSSLRTFLGVFIIIFRTFSVFTLLSWSLTLNFLYFNIFIVLPLAFFVFMFFCLISFIKVLSLRSFPIPLFIIVFPVRRNSWQRWWVHIIGPSSFLTFFDSRFDLVIVFFHFLQLLSLVSLFLNSNVLLIGRAATRSYLNFLVFIVFTFREAWLFRCILSNHLASAGLGG
jgi:hypothetical protein